MSEKFDPKQNIKPKTELDPEIDWEKVLAENGEPLINDPLMVPVNSAEDFLLDHTPDIKESLNLFKSLSVDIQNDILIDLKKQRDLEIVPEEILQRFEILVAKGEELEKMTSEEDSDKKFKPKFPEDHTESNLDDKISDEADRLITEIEEIIKKEEATKKSHIN